MKLVDCQWEQIYCFHCGSLLQRSSWVSLGLKVTVRNAVQNRRKVISFWHGILIGLQGAADIPLLFIFCKPQTFYFLWFYFILCFIFIIDIFNVHLDEILLIPEVQLSHIGSRDTYQTAVRWPRLDFIQAWNRAAFRQFLALIAEHLPWGSGLVSVTPLWQWRLHPGYEIGTISLVPSLRLVTAHLNYLIPM